MNGQLFAGRVVWADIGGFTFACGQDVAEILRIGAFVTASAGEIQVVSAITNIIWNSDDMAQQVARSKDIGDSLLSDQLWRRIGGPAIKCVVIGYLTGGKAYQSLPDRTVISLSQISVMDAEQISEFVLHSDGYLVTILSSIEPQYQADIMANHILYIYHTLNDSQRQEWISTAKRRVSKAMSQDPQNVLRFTQIMAAHQLESSQT